MKQVEEVKLDVDLVRVVALRDPSRQHLVRPSGRFEIGSYDMSYPVGNASQEHPPADKGGR